MWDDDDNKIFDYLGKVTPEFRKLYDKLDETIWLKRQLEEIRNAALLTTSTEWTDEARLYVEGVADNAVPAIKSLDDKIKILKLKIKALEAAL